MFSPVFKAVRRRYPQASIDLVLSNRPAQSCYLGAKEIDRSFIVDTNQTLFPLKIAAFLRFALSARLRERYDICVYEASLHPYWSVILKNIGGIKTNILYPVVADGLAPNVAIARMFDGTADNTDAFISVTEEARKEAEAVCMNQGIAWNTPHMMAVYPSAHLPNRPRWPLHNMIELIKRLKKGAFTGQVVVIGSAADGLDWNSVPEGDIVDANLAGKLSVPASAAVLERCNLAVCNDGGVMHMAGAIGCPLVTIMPNAPSSFNPPGDLTISIHAEIPCSPCYPHVPKTCPDYLCRKTISVDTVYAMCVKLLNGTHT